MASMVPAEVRGYASASTTPLAGAHGAIDLRVAVGTLAQLSERAQANPYVARLAAMLGDLTGSAQVTPSALTGSTTLAIR